MKQTPQLSDTNTTFLFSLLFCVDAVTQIYQMTSTCDEDLYVTSVCFLSHKGKIKKSWQNRFYLIAKCLILSTQCELFCQLISCRLQKSLKHEKSVKI